MSRAFPFAAWRAGQVLLEALVIALALLAIMLLWPFAGQVHGKVLPQVQSFTIETVEQPNDLDGPLISGRFYKPWWAACRFKQVNWYVGVRGHWSEARGIAFNDEKDKGRTTRPAGSWTVFKRWQLRLKPGEWCTPQFADVVHDCGLYDAVTPQWDWPGC